MTKSIFCEENKDELMKYTLDILSVCSTKLDIEYDELLEVFVEYHKAFNKKPSKKKRITTSKIFLEFIIIDNHEYLVDNETGDIFTNDKNQTYVGKYDFDKEVIIVS